MKNQESAEHQEHKRFLKCELHTHSSISDGRDSVEAMVKTAIERDIDVISITDHDTLEGSIRAIEFVEREDLDIVVLPGYELSAKEGHILIFGEESEVYEKGTSVHDIDASSKFLAVAHPYQFYRNGSKNPEEIMNRVDAVEVFNSRTIFKKYTFKAEKLAKKYDKIRIAGSDAHSKEGIGYGITLVFPPAKDISKLKKINPKEMIELLRSGRTHATGKKFPLRKMVLENLKKF